MCSITTILTHVRGTAHLRLLCLRMPGSLPLCIQMERGGAKSSDFTICKLINANGWTKDDLLVGKEEATVLGGDFFLFYTSRQTAPILSFKLYPGTDMSQAFESIVGGLTGRNQQFTLPTAPVLV